MKCEDCKHNDKKWYELPCDYCCPAHSGFEPIPPMELQSPRRKVEIDWIPAWTQTTTGTLTKTGNYTFSTSTEVKHELETRTID